MLIYTLKENFIFYGLAGWYLADGLYLKKSRFDRRKVKPILESGQIYPETGLIFEEPKCMLSIVSNCCMGFAIIE